MHLPGEDHIQGDFTAALDRVTLLLTGDRRHDRYCRQE